MSNRLVTWARNQRTGDPTSQLVLLLLADHAGDDGLCWPSYRLLAADGCMSDRTAMRAVAGLVERGFVTKEQASEGGRQTSNRYWLQAGSEYLRPSGRGDKLTPLNGAGGVTACHPGGDNLTPPGVTTVSPLKEPSEEPSRNQGARASSPDGSRAAPSGEGWMGPPELVEALALEGHALRKLHRSRWDADRGAIVAPDRDASRLIHHRLSGRVAQSAGVQWFSFEGAQSGEEIGVGDGG